MFKMQIFGLIIIGAILLVIVGAFVFSAKFRKDVIAAEGQASVLGLLNVKGVVIVLLVAIFSGVFVYIIRGERDTLSSLNNASDTLSYAGSKISVEGKKKKLLLGEKTLCEANPLLSTCQKRIPSFINKPYSLSEIPDFIYRIDSVRYINSGRTYVYSVSFGEKNGNDTIWWQGNPLYLHKTLDGKITDQNSFEKIHHPSWEKEYHVLMTLGQPDSLLEYVEKAYILVSSTEVDLRKY